MSYDLAVWEGEQPADYEAGARFEALIEQYFEEREPAPPTAKIRAYVDALLEQSPDLPGDGSPWSAGPLIEEASGPVIHFAMQWSRSSEVSAECARIAHVHGLVCYDLQQDCLRPTAEEHARMKASASGGPVSEESG